MSLTNSLVREGQLLMREFERRNNLREGDVQTPRNASRLRREMVQHLDITLRHSLRLIRILFLPEPVVEAVYHRRLNMVLAARLSRLPKAVIAEVVIAAEDLEADINGLVRSYLPDPEPTLNPDRDFNCLCESLESFFDLHGDNIPLMTARRFREHIPRLRSGEKMLNKLLEQLETIK